MELIINDMPQYGVLIHGSETPGFRERLLSLFRDPPVVDDDELPCSIIVENQTLTQLVKIKFICSPYPRESGPDFYFGSGNSSNPVLNDLWGSMIKSGGQCPWSLLDGSWFTYQKAVFTTGEDARRERRDQLKKRLAAIDK